MMNRLNRLSTAEGRAIVWQKLTFEAFERLLNARKSWIDPYTCQLPLHTIEQYYDLRSRLLPWASDANPVHAIWADPKDVIYNHGPWPIRMGLVKSGNWDEPNHTFTDHPIFEALQQHFKEEAPWPETALYQRYAQAIEDGSPYWRCRTHDDLDQYFANTDALYERIRADGYKSQRELLRLQPDETRAHTTDAIHPALHEVSVHIYRDGTLAKARSGFHRLSIARILGLDRIPLTVRVRHTEWQRIRDAIRHAPSESDLPPELLQHKHHPDLTAIWPES